MKDVKKFEQTLESLLEWNSRQAIELDCKKPDLVAFKKKLDIMNKIKKDIIGMYKND